MKFLRTLLKPTPPLCSGVGTRKGVYSVTTSVITNSREEPLYDKQRNKETLKIPLDIVETGKLHSYFHKFHKFHGNFTKFKVLNKNIIVLNSLSTVETMLSKESCADGRLSPFFQQYVLQNYGFSFNNNFTQTCQQQKNIVRNCLNYQISNKNTLIKYEISNTVDQILCSNGDIDCHIHVTNFLSNLFTKLVS